MLLHGCEIESKKVSNDATVSVVDIKCFSKSD